MISVLAPALNEEANIAGTIETVFGAARSAGDVPVELIAVNDGSTDRTGEIIDEFARRDPRVIALHHSSNLGIGASFRNGLACARYPRFMIVPGDNDAPADLLAAVMRAASRADVVLNYWLNKEERGRRRNVLSTLYNTIYMVTFDIFVQYLNGVTVYPTERLKQLQLRSTRFSICAEATIKVLRTGCTFCEVPGYMQTGLEGSTSLGLRNLLEVVRTYLILIWEINVSQRALYAGRPRRVRL
jgi:glycosyltransferase involved in cell wall biosynthesis